MKRTKWNYQKVIEVALKYSTRIDFQKSKRSAYQWCYRNNMLNDNSIFGHMVTPPPNRAKWNIENTLREAKKYTSRKEFETNSAGAYKWARTNKVIDLVCEHMNSNFISWDLNLVIEIAKRYNSKSKFIVDNSGAYGWITRNNHKDNNEIFGHMKNAISGFNRNKPAILYYLKVLGGIAYKIGITNRTITERFCKKDLSKIEVLLMIEFANGSDAKKEEARILKQYKNDKYQGTKLLKDGNTELFRYDILNKDY